MPIPLRLRIVAGQYAVARLPVGSSIPAWASGSGFSAIVRAEDELTIVCSEDRIPEEVEAERGWICLRTIGPFEFQATGIVRSLIEPLSANGIGVFVICTFNGEHLLVSAKDGRKTQDLLIAAGHEFIA
jgi:hypothetical protein